MNSQRNEQFEKTYHEICKPIIARPYPKNEKGEYFYKEIHEAYLMWQAAKAQVPEGFVLVSKLLSDELADELASDAFNNIQSLFDYEHRGSTAIEREELRLRWCRNKAKEYQHHYKTLIEAQEQGHDSAII